MNSRTYTLVLLFIALLVAGGGFYLTEVRQPAKIEQMENARKVAKLQQAEVSQLLAEESATEEQAEETVRKWEARYKYIPEEMETPDIVQYLEGHTRSGFESFNINLEGVTRQSDFSYYTFNVEGTAYYSSLYHFIWHIENNRQFYRLHNLSLQHTDVFDENPRTGEQQRKDMVKFSFKLDAYFDGAEGMSATEGELMPAPVALLPDSLPAQNSFYPHVRAELPPNDELLVDVEKARLVSIAGGTAVFEDERGQHVLQEGDDVYLGRIIEIHPGRAAVRARLNKGGVVDTVEVRIEDTEEPFRQAQGGTQRVTPLNQR